MAAGGHDRSSAHDTDQAHGLDQAHGSGRVRGADRVRGAGGNERADPFSGTVRRTVPLILSCALLVASAAAYTGLHLLTRNDMADLLVYRAEGSAVLHGHDLYGLRVTEWDLPATYPPFAAILFVPTALVGVPVLKVLVTAGNVALLAALVRLSLRLAFPRRAPHRAPRPPSGPFARRFADRTPRPYARRVSGPRPCPGDAAHRPGSVAVLLATAGGIWLEPVFQTLHFGQINLLIAVLVLGDLSRPDGARTKGVALGVAAGIKLTPAVFIVYLLVSGRVRAALTGAGAFFGTVAIGWAVLPGPSAEFWTRRVFETGRVGRGWIVDNQSLRGLLARLLHTGQPGGAWVAVAALTAVAGLAVAVRAARCGAEAWGAACCAVTALLVSPISWSHHWVWCVPLLALLAADAASLGEPPGTRGYRGTEATSATPAATGQGHGPDPGWGPRSGPRPGRGALPVVTCAAAVVFLARSMWLVPKDGDLDLRLPWWQQPAAAPYPLLGIAFLVYALLRPVPPSPGTDDGPGAAPSGVLPRQGGEGCQTSSSARSSSASTIR